MKYTQKELFLFMDEKRPVRVTSKTGKIYTGLCWAYSDVFNMEEDGIDEPSIEVNDTVLYLSEIDKIEYAD